MKTRGLITCAGLLYEGSNYSKWRAKVEAIIKLHYGSTDPRQPLPILAYVDSETSSAKIRYLVSEGLLQRVPENIKSKPLPLLDYLSELAKPFDLMGLTAEVRVKIYDYALQNEEEFHEIWWQFEGILYKSRSPALLCVSLQVRKEAMPVFYETKKFGVRFADSIGRSTKHTTFALQKWAANIAGERLRHLRNVFFQVHQEHLTFDVDLHYSEQEGLHMSWFKLHYSDDDHFEDQLKAHIAATEVYRQATDMKGEAIILVITSKRSLWGIDV